MTGETVLVVEDETDLADLYAAWLSDDYDVRIANSAGEALETVDESVSVVLLDRRLPDRSGNEVLAEIRDRGLGCRVAMVTAVDPDFDIIDMGFDDYLVKPVTREGLTSTVERLVIRHDYDVRLREYASLVWKRALLEGEKSDAELQRNESYQELVERVDELEAEIDGLLGEFDEDDFSTAFRDVGRGAGSIEGPPGDG